MFSAIMGVVTAPPAPSAWTFTWSSVLNGAATPSGQAAMQDGDIVSSGSVWGSDAGVGTGGGQWLRADFGAPRLLSSISVRSAASGTWGAQYTNGAVLQWSLDGSTWNTVATISGMVSDNTTPYTANTGGVVARYARLFRSGGNYTAAGDFFFT